MATFSQQFRNFTDGSGYLEVFPELKSLSPKDRKVVESQLLRKLHESQRQRRKRQGCRNIQPHVQQPTSCNRDGSVSSRWEKIIWVGFPDNPAPWNVKESKSLCIEVVKSNRDLGGLDWLDDHDILKLEHGLGSFYSRGKESVDIHQGLATMLIAKSLISVPVELHSWRWLESQLRDNARRLRLRLTDSNDRPVTSVIILHCTTTKPANLLEVCRQIESLSSELHIRCYPRESELRQDQGKHDWKILDQVAARSSVAEYRFRPKTCPGKGECLLHDKRVTFMKREQSNGGSHVGYQVESDRGFLQCDVRDQEVRKKLDPQGYHWFHQQYIDSLDTREIRVGVAMEGDPQGIRGLRGRVVQKVTTRRDPNNNILCRAFEASDLENEECGHYTEEKVDNFALWTINRLLELPDALELFGSLQVGVRLDIGFCHGFPFVNEVVRIYNAHFFSLSGSPEPFTKMVKAVAISLLRHLDLFRGG